MDAPPEAQLPKCPFQAFFGNWDSFINLPTTWRIYQSAKIVSSRLSIDNLSEPALDFWPETDFYEVSWRLLSTIWFVCTKFDFSATSWICLRKNWISGKTLIFVQQTGDFCQRLDLFAPNWICSHKLDLHASILFLPRNGFCPKLENSVKHWICLQKLDCSALPF